MTPLPPSSSLSHIPAVDAVLRLPAATTIVGDFGHARLLTAVRTELDRTRARLGGDRPEEPVPTADEVLAAAVARLRTEADRRVRRVVNATGVIVRTNLGRAPLSEEARRAVAEAAGYATLEFDAGRGARDSRTGYPGELAAGLCGTESATVVNNGAAALLLVLAALAGGREVVVSRGELIEIGGSFRLPDVMAVAGVRLVEVGTTNRTQPDEYRQAVGPMTALLLKAHHSNFRQIGFTRDVTTSELAAVGRETGLPVVYDVGYGLIHDAPSDGPMFLLASEPPARRAVAEGADLIVFSGDKLLGGPQAGIVAGRRELVRACERHPLARALRIDKLQRAALEATLEAHLHDAVPASVPTVAMLTADPGQLETRARALATRVRARLRQERSDDASLALRVEPVDGVVGGGALPGTSFPSWALGPGIHARPDVASAAEALGAPATAAVGLVDVLLDRGTLVRTEHGVVLPENVDTATNERRARTSAVLGALLAELFAPPDLDELTRAHGLDARERAALVSRGDVVRCGRVAFAASAVDQAIGRLRELQATTGPFTASQAREALGTTRRYAIPLLEHLERTGVTRFDGERHQLR